MIYYGLCRGPHLFTTISWTVIVYYFLQATTATSSTARCFSFTTVQSMHGGRRAGRRSIAQRAESGACFQCFAEVLVSRLRLH